MLLKCCSEFRIFVRFLRPPSIRDSETLLLRIIIRLRANTTAYLILNYFIEWTLLKVITPITERSQPIERPNRHRKENILAHSHKLKETFKKREVALPALYHTFHVSRKISRAEKSNNIKLNVQILGPEIGLAISESFVPLEPK